jgi:hypothetical protein
MAQLALCLSAALCSLLSLHSFKLVLWVSVLPQILSVLSALSLCDTRIEGSQRQSLPQILKEALIQFKANAKLRLLALADTLDFGFGEATFYFQSAFFITLVPAWVLSLARCLNHFAAFVGFWFAGRLVAFYGARRTLIVGTGLSTLIKICAVLFASAWSPFVMGMTNLAFGPSTTARGALLHLEFSDRQRATMGSMVSFSGSVLFAIVSALLGFIADLASPGTALLVGLSSSLVIIALYRQIFGREYYSDRIVS